MPAPLLVAAVAPLAGKLVDAIAGLFPDSKAKAEAEAKLTATLIEAGLAQEAQQSQVNAVEAAHRSIFVAGWRPGLMWVCVSCVFYTWWIYPWLIFFVDLHYGWEVAARIPVPPTGELWVLIMGAMGLGGMRTFEKFKGVAR